MDPLLCPAPRIVTVIPESDPRIVQPVLRGGGIEGTLHRYETAL
jgi:hypothetical protein